MSKKNIQFDYFTVYTRNVENHKMSEKLFDITPILKLLKKTEVVQTTRECMAEKARVQYLEFDKENKIWEIQLLRLREVNIPGIADDDGTYDVIKLDDGKYVGEFASALYDADEKIFILHRNRNSITPSGVEEYLNRLSPPHTFTLKPVISDMDIKGYLQGKLFRRLSIGVHTKKLEELSDGSSFMLDLLKKLNKLEGASIKIDVSLGNTRKDRTLSDTLVDSVIDELGEFNGTRTLSVGIKESPDTKVENVDLLKNRVKDIVEFTNVNKQNPLEHNKVFNKLKECYLDRKKKGEIYI